MATARIVINLYDGTRQLMPSTATPLITVTDGNKQVVFRDFINGPTMVIDVPCYDNLRDQYTVVASAKNSITAGFFPVNVSPNVVRPVFLMLPPSNPEFNFLKWKDLKQRSPQIAKLFSKGVRAPAAKRRYEDLIEDQPMSLACLFNILTTAGEIRLGTNTVLDYFRVVVWDEPNRPMKQDRFFAYADPELLTQVRVASEAGEFAEEPNPGILHEGATCSFKQLQFGEANLQLTFHENDPSPPRTNWMLVESDIDYFKDLGAHTLLEVLPGFFGLTDPTSVYVLRWIAGRQANMAEFNPPYTIRSSA
jgi:hypothetical protein